jgi:hypothetical protein
MLEGDVWHPDRCFTKQVVESEKLPSILSSILDHNLTVNEMNQGLLRAVLRCVSAFSENHDNCLEGMLRFGFRTKLIALLQQAEVNEELLRTGLATLAVLCGHTHSSSVDIPALTCTPKELFNILFILHQVLKVLLLRPFPEVNQYLLVNTFMVLRYTLPVMSASDPLFQVGRLQT